uniref:Uncharacterized protein n=1 Tax=Anopheles aquasalis TaxID=42839 RepID=T1E8Q0_ANOAQ
MGGSFCLPVCPVSYARGVVGRILGRGAKNDVGQKAFLPPLISAHPFCWDRWADRIGLRTTSFDLPSVPGVLAGSLQDGRPVSGEHHRELGKPKTATKTKQKNHGNHKSRTIPLPRERA